MAKGNSTRLTDKFIRSLKPPAKGNVRYTDTEIPGLAIRVTASGQKSFVLDYRVHGRNRRYTIAGFPEYNATAARDEAIELRKGIRKGIDPLEVKQADTVAELAEQVMDYLKAHKRRPATLKAYQSMLDNNILPKLGKRKVKDVTYGDIQRLHTSMADTPYRANRVLQLLSRMFNEAIRQNAIDDNPVAGVEKYTEEPRNIELKPDQLKALIKAMDNFRDRNTASALVLIMLTGCRKVEALAATWDQFDLEAGTWTKPSHHTKQKKLHRVPLNPAAVALLQGLPHRGDYVFPGRPADTPLKDIKNAWNAIRNSAGLPTLRIHDLRHVYASLLAAQNLSLPVIGALLGHTQQQTTQRYAHLLDAPLRDATNGVGALIEGARK